MAKKRDTSKMKVESKREMYGTYAVTVYVASVTGDEFIERTNYLVEREYLKDVDESRSDYPPYTVYEKAHKKGDFEYHRRTSVAQKVLCVGGPLNGTRTARFPKGYRAYNAADFNRGRAKNKHIRVVYIHEDLLEQN